MLLPRLPCTAVVAAVVAVAAPAGGGCWPGGCSTECGGRRPWVPSTPPAEETPAAGPADARLPVLPMARSRPLLPPRGPTSLAESASALPPGPKHGAAPTAQLRPGCCCCRPWVLGTPRRCPVASYCGCSVAAGCCGCPAAAGCHDYRTG